MAEEGIEVAKVQRDRHLDDGNVNAHYDSLDDLKQAVLSGSWDPSFTRIHISDIPYTLPPTQNVNWMEVLSRKSPLVVIYRQPHKAWTEEGNKTGLGPWVVIVWRKYNGNIFKPATVFTTRKHVFTNRVKEYMSEAVSDEKLIGSTILVKITNLPASNEMKARVDTGATVSSLHCDRWKIVGDMVEFVNTDLSPNVIRLPLVTHQATKTSDGGTENRPVITLSVRINGQVLPGMQFNLNNRQHMEYPVLIGQNILQKGKFLIDPSMVSEDVDWESLNETVTSELDKLPSIVDDTHGVGNIANGLMSGEISFADIIAHCRKNDSHIDK